MGHGINRAVGSSRRTQLASLVDVLHNLLLIQLLLQNATKMIHLLLALLPLAPMLGHYTTTRPRKSSPSAVDTAVVLRVSMPRRNKIFKRHQEYTPLQLQRTLVDGIPSDILSKRSMERECGVATKPSNQTFRADISPRGRYSPRTSNMTAPHQSYTRPSSMVLRSMTPQYS